MTQQNALTSSAVDSPVRTSAKQGTGSALPANDPACGVNTLASFAFYDLASSSWRTSQTSLFEGLTEFSGTWPASGSMRNGHVFERPTPVLPTVENESLFWPTPTATDYKRGNGHPTAESPGRKYPVNKSGTTLNQAVGGYPSPQWTEWLMGFPARWTEPDALVTPSSRSKRR